MSKASDIINSNQHFAVRYIRQRINKIPTSTSPNHPFNESVSIHRSTPNSALSPEYLREDTISPLERPDIKRSKIFFPRAQIKNNANNVREVSPISQISADVDEIPQIESDCNTVKETSQREDGFFSSKWLKTMIYIGIGLLAASIVIAAVVLSFLL